MSTDTNRPAIASDVLWGTAAIGAHIGRTERQTYHLLECGKLPGKKIGGKWTSTKAKLDRAVGRVEEVA